MAIDPGAAEMMRDDLSALDGISEKKMFGGLCFLSGGHMICGLHKGGTMYRVGKESYAEALTLPGVQPMLMGDRPMAAMVTPAAMDTSRGLFSRAVRVGRSCASTPGSRWGFTPRKMQPQEEAMAAASAQWAPSSAASASALAIVRLLRKTSRHIVGSLAAIRVKSLNPLAEYLMTSWLDTRRM